MKNPSIKFPYFEFNRMSHVLHASKNAGRFGIFGQCCYDYGKINSALTSKGMH